VKSVDTILFDLSEVYISGLKGTHERVGRHLDLPVDRDAFLGESVKRLFHGEITEEEYWRAVIATNEWQIEVDDLRRMVRQNFAPIDGTEAIVRELRAGGYRLGVLSVHAREWVEYCERKFDYRQHFDAVVYSYEHALSKPDPAAYERALEALGAEAETTVFVDDVERNVRAAEALGMQAIHFVDAGQLRARLVEMRVLPGDARR
jgi:2-haloacid dehalogenase